MHILRFVAQTRVRLLRYQTGQCRTMYSTPIRQLRRNGQAKGDSTPVPKRNGIEPRLVTVELARLQKLVELEKRLLSSVHTFFLIVKPRKSSFPWSVNTNTVTLRILATAISSQNPEVNDTYQFYFEVGGRKLPYPRNDEDLRYLLRTQIARDEMTMTVEAVRRVKTFSEFTMEDVCRLYGIFYEPQDPLTQFPKLECKTEPVDNKLLSSLMNQLTDRMDVTPIGATPETHQTIYVYVILLALTRLSKLRIYPKRYINSSTATGRADYSVEFQDGQILGVTEVKRQDYMLGIAQNAIQIRSVVDQNQNVGITRRTCFGIATDARMWYFLEYTQGNIPRVSKEYALDYRKEAQLKKDIKELAEVILWLLKKGKQRRGGLTLAKSELK